MKLHFLDGGKIEMERQGIINDPDQDGSEKLVVPVSYNLIEHPKGLILFDTGNSYHVVDDAIGYWGEIANDVKTIMTHDNFVVNQLKKINIDPSDIKYVVLSHLHLDHSGGIGYFPNATYIVQKEELSYAYNPAFFQKEVFIKSDFDKDVKWFTLNGYLDDELDLFNDGTIKIFFTPGHTPGHQSLLLNLENTGKVLLTGDAVHLLVSIEKDILPAQSLCYSAGDYVNSVARLRIMRNNGIKLFVGHDPKDWENIKILD
jgi:N-acyl homoserine lactone hydrolase